MTFTNISWRLVRDSAFSYNRPPALTVRLRAVSLTTQRTQRTQRKTLRCVRCVVKETAPKAFTPHILLCYRIHYRLLCEENVAHSCWEQGRSWRGLWVTLPVSSNWLGEVNPLCQPSSLSNFQPTVADLAGSRTQLSQPLWLPLLTVMTMIFKNTTKDVTSRLYSRYVHDDVVSSS